MIKMIACLLMCYSPLSEVFHSEVVGEVRIDNFKNELFVEVILDKRMLSTALIMEADCAPQEMLSLCGSEYFQNHTQLRVNSLPVTMQRPEMEVFKTQVLYRYYVGDFNQPFTTLEVESDYLFDYHEHSIIKVKVGVNDAAKSYNLSKQRTKIQAIIQ